MKSCLRKIILCASSVIYFVEFIFFPYCVCKCVCVCICACEIGELDHAIYGTPVYVALEVFNTHTHTHTHGLIYTFKHTHSHMSAVFLYLPIYDCRQRSVYIRTSPWSTLKEVSKERQGEKETETKIMRISLSAYISNGLFELIYFDF